MEKFLKNKKVSEKLKASFSLILVIFIITAVMAVAGLTTINMQMKNFYEESYYNSVLQMEIRKDVQAVGKFVLSAVVAESAEDTQAKIEEAAACAQRVGDNSTLLAESFDDKELTTQLQTDLASLKKAREKVMELTASQKNEEAMEVFNTIYTPETEKIQNVLIEIGSASDAAAKKAYELSWLLGIVIEIIMIVLAVICAIICIRLARAITSAICEPVSELETAAAKLRNGELDMEIHYTGEDELGSLAENFREACTQIQVLIDDMSMLLVDMAGGNFAVRTQAEDRYVGNFQTLLLSIRKLNRELDATLKQINESSDQVAIGSGQMAESAQALAEGATDQAGAVEELTATVENVTNISEESAENAKSAAQKVSATAKNAERSREEMAQLTSAMERISETSKEIENIIGAIEDIASQTNLLSLNASIEAARAGEAGKGFAVVADQIGKLAADSAQSAVTTRELIGKALEEIENGNEITKRTSEVIGEVLAGMAEFEGLASGAADASVTQADMLRQVEAGIEQISTVVQNNSAAAEETSAVSEELSAQAENLKEMVAKFKLRE